MYIANHSTVAKLELKIHCERTNVVVYYLILYGIAKGGWNIERQLTGNYCGVYALACATDLAHNLLHVKWDSEAMRQHIISCLEAGQVSPFPRERESEDRARRTCYYVWGVWSHCIAYGYDGSSYIECGSCHS